MSTSRSWLSGLLAVGALYHVLLGLAVLLFKERAADMAQIFFRFNLTPSPELLWILNPFAAYLLAFGLTMAVVARSPGKHLPVVWVVVVLYAIRFVERAWFAVAADETLKVSVEPMQQTIHLAVVLAMTLALGALAMRVPSEG